MLGFKAKSFSSIRFFIGLLSSEKRENFFRFFSSRKKSPWKSSIGVPRGQTRSTFSPLFSWFLLFTFSCGLLTFVVRISTKNTVKPELTTTSEKRPPVYNDHYFKSSFPHLENKETFEQRPPVNSGHYFWVPRVVVVHRFDCI